MHLAQRIPAGFITPFAEFLLQSAQPAVRREAEKAMGFIPMIKDPAHQKLLLFVIIGGFAISVFTFIVEAEHWQVGIALLLLSALAYLLWRWHPEDDCYAIVFWLSMIMGVAALLMDIKDLL
jgi:hypothetical protein